MSEPEELRLIESFDELRAGMLVVLKACAICGRDHRGMLVHARNAALAIYRGEVAPSAVWDYCPRPGCKPKATGGLFGPEAVDERRVYVVLVPPTADEQTTATSAPTKRVRERETSR